MGGPEPPPTVSRTARGVLGSPPHMPRRTDIKKIMIVGSGPIVIGQACEFDYSGTQACKALKEEGYEIVLLNSNPATIMTDPGFADRTYVEPITPEVAEQIIAREKPDVLLPTLGGQTALNLAVALARNGALARHGVELIGARSRPSRRPRTGTSSRRRWSASGSSMPRVRLRDELGGGPRHRRGDRLPGHHPPSLHDGRRGRRRRLQPRGVRAARAARARPLPDAHASSARSRSSGGRSTSSR